MRPKLRETDTRLPLKLASCTHAGRRVDNQDAAFTWQNRLHREGPRAAVGVADGMGGRLGGERASAAAVASLGQTLRGGDPEADVRETLACAYLEAHRRLAEQQADNPLLAEMGTTLATAVVVGNRVVIANLGDSRVYRLRQGLIEQLTADHTAVAESVARGSMTQDEAEHHPMSHVLTRALDGKEEPQVDFLPPQGEGLELADGDLLLVCSDGLYNAVTPDEMREALLHTPTLDEAAERLVRLAYQKGSDDNITVVLLEAGVLPRQAGGLSPIPTIEEQQRQEGLTPAADKLRRAYALLAALTMLFFGLCYATWHVYEATRPTESRTGDSAASPRPTAAEPVPPEAAGPAAPSSPQPGLADASATGANHAVRPSRSPAPTLAMPKTQDPEFQGALDIYPSPYGKDINRRRIFKPEDTIYWKRGKGKTPPPEDLRLWVTITGPGRIVLRGRKTGPFERSQFTVSDLTRLAAGSHPGWHYSLQGAPVDYTLTVVLAAPGRQQYVDRETYRVRGPFPTPPAPANTAPPTPRPPTAPRTTTPAATPKPPDTAKSSGDTKPGPGLPSVPDEAPGPAPSMAPAQPSPEAEPPVTPRPPTTARPEGPAAKQPSSNHGATQPNQRAGATQSPATTAAEDENRSP